MKNFTLSSMLKRIFTAFVALLCITTVSAQDWTLIEENSMAGNYNTPIEDPIFYWDSWERYQTEFDESNFYPAVYTTGYDYIGVKVEIAEAGEYKYSFDFKNETNDGLTAQLFYDSRSEELNDRRPVSATMDVLEEVQTIESDAINLSAGTYYFAIVTNNENYFADGTMFACANFKLYKKGGAVAPTTYEVTWAAPANGTLVIKNGTEELSSPATVEENTELTVEATANPNYELETLTAGGVDIMADMKFVVTANTEVVATFKETVEPGVNYTAPEYTKDEDHVFENYIYRYATEFTMESAAGTSTWTYDGNRVFYNVLSEFTTDALAGETVTVNFKAFDENKDAGTTDADKPLREDLRWTIATLHIDWDRDGVFESSEKIAGLTGAEIGTGNDNQLYYGNRDYIYDITKEITIPEGTTPGKVRVRLNYTNAWIGNDPISAFAEKSKEGIVYDFDINVVEAQAPVTYQVSWTKPEFGNLVVKNGTEELTSPATVEENTVLTIEPEAEAGYQLVSVTANGNIIEAVEGVYSITVNAETVIAATFETEGPKTRQVTWSKTGSKAWWGVLDIYIDDEREVHDEGAGSGVLDIVDGQTVKIATSVPADKGMAFVKVGGKDVELDSEGCYTFTMGPTTTSIEVVFDLPKIKVQMNKVGEGELSISVGGATYGGTNTYLNKDDVFTVNATPAQGYKLESLEVLIGGEAQTGDQFTATADVVINATFTEITYQTVTLVKPENGDITLQYEEDGRTKVVSTEEFSDDSKTFEVEDNVVLTITAQPDKNYELVAISCNGEELQGSTFTVTAETTISAEFQLAQYTVTFEQPENATVKVMNGDNEINSGDKLNAGTEITVVAEAELGYEIEAIKVNDKDITLDGKFTLTEDANIVVTVKIIDAINETAAAEVYYNNAEQAIYTNNAKAVKVYDLSGRLVLNAENQTVVSVNELADGFYTAVVDGTVIKFNK